MTIGNVIIRFGKNENELIRAVADEMDKVHPDILSILANFTSSLNPNDRIFVTKENDIYLINLFVLDAIQFRGNSFIDMLTEVVDELMRMQ